MPAAMLFPFGLKINKSHASVLTTFCTAQSHVHIGFFSTTDTILYRSYLLMNVSYGSWRLLYAPSYSKGAWIAVHTRYTAGFVMHSFDFHTNPMKLPMLRFNCLGRWKDVLHGLQRTQNCFVLFETVKWLPPATSCGTPRE